MYSWAQDKVNSEKIQAARMDSEFDGIAIGLSTAILKDGQQTITANIPWNNFKITGLGNATAATDAMNRQTGDGRWGQLTAANTWTAVNLFSLRVGINNVTSTSRLAVRADASTPQIAIHNPQVGGDPEAGAVAWVGTEGLFASRAVADSLRLRAENQVAIGIAGSVILSVAGSTVEPGTDNAVTCGGASYRWSTVYAASGAISTSDRREKTLRDSSPIGGNNLVSPFSAGEIAAAKQLAAEIGVFRFIDAVASKGSGARLHIGMTVQRAIQIMQANGLDPFAYGFICFDEWEETPATEAQEAVPPEYPGDPKARPAIPADPGRPAGDLYSFRFDELSLFIARGFEARLSALEGA